MTSAKPKPLWGAAGTRRCHEPAPDETRSTGSGVLRGRGSAFGQRMVALRREPDLNAAPGSWLCRGPPVGSGRRDGLGERVGAKGRRATAGGATIGMRWRRRTIKPSSAAMRS